MPHSVWAGFYALMPCLMHNCEGPRPVGKRGLMSALLCNFPTTSSILESHRQDYRKYFHLERCTAYVKG